jgi:hypothetical protein
MFYFIVADFSHVLGSFQDWDVPEGEGMDFNFVRWLAEVWFALIFFF